MLSDALGFVKLGGDSGLIDRIAKLAKEGETMRYMDGDNVILAYTVANSSYAEEIAREIPGLTMQVFRDDDEFPALQGRKLFHYLYDIADREAFAEILLLLPANYSASQAHMNVQTDHPSLFEEQYLFKIRFDDSDEFVSIPDIYCSTLRERDIPKPIQAKQDPRRSSQGAPSDQSESPDKFIVPRRPTGTPPGFPQRRDKLNRHNKDKRFATRLQDFERVFQLYPTNPVGYYLGMGHLLWYEERYEEARQAYLNAILWDSNNAKAYNGLGNTYWCLEQYNEALKAYEKATQLREQRPIG